MLDWDGVKLMGTQDRFLRDTHLRLVNMVSVRCFLYRKLLLFTASFWVSVSALFLTLFHFLYKSMIRFVILLSTVFLCGFMVGFFNFVPFIFRVKGNEKYQGCSEKVDSNPIEKEAEAQEPEVEGNNQFVADHEEENESPKLVFNFKYQTFRDEYEPLVSDSAPSSSTANKYEFLSGKDSSHYMKKPQVFSLTVTELYAGSNGVTIGYKAVSPDEEFVEEKAEAESVREKTQVNSRNYSHEEEEAGKEAKQENSTGSPLEEEETAKLEAEGFNGLCNLGKGKEVDAGDNVLVDQDVSRDVQFLSEKDFVALGSDSDSITSSHEILSRFMPSTSDGFLSDKDFEDEVELDTLIRDIGGDEEVELTDEDLELEEIDLENMSAGYEADDFDEEDSDILDEIKNLEESNMQTSDDNNSKQEQSSKDHEQKDGLDATQESSACDDDSNGLETLWEHQDLIEQLKMELKKVRATGLPTILEEDECPKIMEDLKPWKIEEKFQYQDKMGELHKFYRSYRERMRKFDIFNYQKMYAIGFLHSKDPLEVISSQKFSELATTSSTSTSTSSSLLLKKLQSFKRKKSVSDPMVNFLRDLHSDLETVYVGQMCLSWEILHWQYEKALDLWDSDPYGMRRYNEVAGEFQQFQVLMQRFIENEPFEGPRVQNYVKNRCALRNLLQVPVIREDSAKDKKARRKVKDDHTITSDTLVEIMEESIRIFWRFVRADKDAHNVIQKGRKGTQIEPQDPAELELLTEVLANLQKKEKKLKEILRSGNCILKKFRKHQEDSSDHVLYFFSQVDMKLVSRVLNMSKLTTEQLVWCHNKLSKIKFVSRKINVEPSFLLFPC